MPAPPRNTNIEIAEQFRARANHTTGAEQKRLLHLAQVCDREDDLVAGSRRVIAESKTLLAEIKRFFP